MAARWCRPRLLPPFWGLAGCPGRRPTPIVPFPCLSCVRRRSRTRSPPGGHHGGGEGFDRQQLLVTDPGAAAAMQQMQQQTLAAQMQQQQLAAIQQQQLQKQLLAQQMMMPGGLAAAAAGAGGQASQQDTLHRKQREVYIGNLAIGIITKDLLQEFWDQVGGWGAGGCGRAGKSGGGGRPCRTNASSGLVRTCTLAHHTATLTHLPAAAAPRRCLRTRWPTR